MNSPVASDVMSGQMSNIDINTYGFNRYCPLTQPFQSWPDGISTTLIQINKHFPIIFLRRVFQQPVTTECLPNDWRLVHVIPIFKSGAASFTNYRPISLTCVSCKHMLSSNTINYLTSNNLLYINGYG